MSRELIMAEVPRNHEMVGEILNIALDRLRSIMGNPAEGIRVTGMGVAVQKDRILFVRLPVEDLQNNVDEFLSILDRHKTQGLITIAPDYEGCLLQVLCSCEKNVCHLAYNMTLTCTGLWTFDTEPVHRDEQPRRQSKKSVDIFTDQL